MAAMNHRLKSEKFPSRNRAFLSVAGRLARERSELLENAFHPVAAIVSIAILMIAVGTTAAT